jgi:hypothetical protein
VSTNDCCAQARTGAYSQWRGCPRPLGTTLSECRTVGNMCHRFCPRSAEGRLLRGPILTLRANRSSGAQARPDAEANNAERPSYLDCCTAPAVRSAREAMSRAWKVSGSPRITCWPRCPIGATGPTLRGAWPCTQILPSGKRWCEITESLADAEGLGDGDLTPAALARSA